VDFLPDPTWVTIDVLNAAIPGFKISSNDVVDFENIVGGPDTNGPVAGDVGLATATGNSVPHDNVLGIATAYVNNKSGGPLGVTVCSASDDAIDIFVNNCLNTESGICRGTAGDCDGPKNAATLVSGINKLTVLVWEGGGGWGFRLALHRASDDHRYTDADAAELEVLDPGSAAGKAAKTPTLECVEASRSVAGKPYSCPLGPSDTAKVTMKGVVSGDPAAAIHIEELIQVNCMANLTVNNISNGGTLTPLTSADSSDPVITDLPNTVHVGADAGAGATASGSGLGPYSTTDTSAGDMWTGGDTYEFQYADVAAGANFDISCEVLSYSHTANGGQRRWGRTGLLARSFIDETALAAENKPKYTLVYRNGPTDVEANAFEQGRINQNQDPNDAHFNDGSSAFGKHPRFFRLTRRGNVVQGWGSICPGLADGTLNPRNDANWTPVGRADNWGDSPAVKVGYCNSEHGSDGVNVQTVTYRLLNGGTGGSATNAVKIAWDTTKGQFTSGLSYDMKYAGREASRHKFSTTLANSAAVDKGGSAVFDNTQTGPIGIFANSHDIGGPRTSGSTTYDAGTGTYTLVSSGDDIWAGGDQFQFAYSPVTGDFILEAHVSDRKNSEWDGRWGKHGLMARNTCDFNAKYSHIQTYLVNFGNYPGEVDTPRHAHRVNQFDTGATRENYEVNDGAFVLDPSTAAYNPAGTVRWPSWMRIIRRGKAIHSFMSVDDGAGHPAEWKAIGADSNPANPETMLVGLALTSHAGNETASVSFDHVSLTPLSTPAEACSAGATITGTDFAFPDGTDPTTLGFVKVKGGGFDPVITGGRLQITNESTGGSANAVWFPAPGIGALPGFTVDFDAFMTRAPGNAPADGMTFAVVQGNAAFAAGLRGDGGGSLGYDGNSLRGNAEGHPSFAVELDNWQTGGEPGNEGLGSPDNQFKWHMGVDVMASVSSIQTNKDFTGSDSLPDIFDPLGVHVQVVYKNSGSINAYVSANNGSSARTHVLSAMIPPLTGADLLLGFTGGTGGATCTQEVDNTVVSQICCEESADSASIAGASSAAAGATVALNGTAGGIDTGKTATYLWSIVSGAGTIQGAANGANVNVKSTTAGDTVVRLRVTDGVCSDAGFADHTISFCADFSVTIDGPATPPTAGDTVDLTGTTDATGGTLSWSIDSGSGTIVGAADGATVKVTSAAAGDTVVKLTVTDSCGTAKSATNTVTFKSVGVGPFLRGDCNGDGKFTGTVTDAVFLLSFNFQGGAAPPCNAACDANGDGSFVGTVTDAVYMLQFNFLGGPAPPAPYPNCGIGPSAKDTALGCATPTAACP
jgi:hypothetical protein